MSEDTLETIGQMRASGITSMYVTCADCRCWHSASVTFDSLGLTDSDTFVETRARLSPRFKCVACGRKHVSIMPDWTGHRAVGKAVGFR